jgi:hypothetical protein
VEKAATFRVDRLAHYADEGYRATLEALRAFHDRDGATVAARPM